jgi:cardiolipin synthase
MSSYIFRDDAAGQRIRRRPDRGGKGAAWPCACCWTVWARLYLFGRLRSPAARRGDRRALPAHLAALAHAVPQHAQSSQASGGGWRLAFMGGINVGAENSARLSGDHQIRDVHFRVEGPVVRLIMDAFARDWTFTTNESLDDDCWWPELARGAMVLRARPALGPDADIYKLELILGAALTWRKKRMCASSRPISCPIRGCNSPSQQAGLRGVTVEIVLPGKATSASWTGRCAGICAFSAISAPHHHHAAALRSFQAVHHGWGMVADRQLQLGCAQLPAEFRIRSGTRSADGFRSGLGC